MTAAVMKSYTLKEVSREVIRMEENKMNIYEKLSNIQCELKAPKNQYSDYGDYFYRNCEDILEAAKPLCNKYGITLVIGDNVVQIGDRFYVKATVTLVDWISKDSIENVSFARECKEKKKMDDSQVTGATSSYARKYALNGLFNIDDTKDPDTDEFKKQQEKESQKNENSPKKSIEELSVEYSSCRNKLFDLDVDVRSEQIVQWMAEKTGYPNQEIDLTDQVKMEKLIAAYHVLIKGKEQKKDAKV